MNRNSVIQRSVQACQKELRLNGSTPKAEVLWNVALSCWRAYDDVGRELVGVDLSLESDRGGSVVLCNCDAFPGLHRVHDE